MSRHIAFERLHNFRDLGGYRAHGGRRVAWGRLYRSDSLARLRAVEDDEDWNRFRSLGVRTVIDLRYPWEIAAKGRVPDYEGLDYHNLSIEHRPYDQAAIDPGVDPWRFLADRFAEVAADGTGEIRRALEVIARGAGSDGHSGDGDGAPVVFHCASGKDRTGLLGALVLSLLGVSEQDITADFALTELATDRLVADWSEAHQGRTPGWPAYGRAPARVMRLVLDDLASTYGSVRAYAAGPLGVDDELVAALRRRLLDGAATTGG